MIKRMVHFIESKKQPLAALLLAVCLFVSACGAKEQDNESAALTAESGEETAADTSAEENAEAASEPEDADAVPEEEDENVGEAYEPVVLLDEPEVAVTYAAALSYNEGVRVDVLRIDNRWEEPLDVSVEGIRLNGHILVSDRVTGYADPGETEERTLDGLTKAVLLAEEDGVKITELSFLLTVENRHYDLPWEERVLYEQNVTVTLPEDGYPAFVCTPVMDMLAEEQVLFNEGGITVTLLGCGDYIGASYPVSGILKIENMSDDVMPYKYSAIQVNGHITDSYADGGRGDLAPGGKTFVKFYVYNLDKEGITSVADLKIQLLTSGTENTGTFVVEGGSWYDVELAQHGDPGENFEMGVVVYEDEYVVIGYRGVENVYTEYDWTDNSGHMTWFLSYKNKSRENIELLSDEETADGKSGDEALFEPFLLDGDLSPGGMRYGKISFYYDGDRIDEIPEVAFRVKVLKQGGGALLNYSEEVVVLDPAMVISTGEDSEQTEEEEELMTP